MNRRRHTGFGPHVTASELGKLSECEMAVMLEMQEEDDPNAPHRVVGRQEHSRFEVAAAQHHDKGAAALQQAQNAAVSGPAGKASPCFIASAVYGPHAPETNELRRFRDRVLLRHGMTAWTVPVYYALAPGVAAMLARHPPAARMVRRRLDRLRAALPASWKSPS